MTEEQEKWYERETAAFRAWWEANGEKTYSETPTMAAGAGWLKRAESSAHGVYATNDKRKFEALDLSASSEKQRNLEPLFEAVRAFVHARAFSEPTKLIDAERDLIAAYSELQQ